MTSAVERSGERAGRWMVLLLGGLTLLVFGGGGVLLMALVQDRDPWAAVFAPATLAVQLAWGLGAGLGIGLAARAIVRSPAMRELDERFARHIGGRVSGWSDRLFLSVCAGVGEELFFRGALQHWLGVVPTAVLFVAIHGYLDPRDRRMLLYGLFLTLAMCGIGLLAQHVGLFAPMLAHTLIDLVLFGQLVRTHRRLVAREGPVNDAG